MLAAGTGLKLPVKCQGTSLHSTPLCCGTHRVQPRPLAFSGSPGLLSQGGEGSLFRKALCECWSWESRFRLFALPQFRAVRGGHALPLSSTCRGVRWGQSRGGTWTHLGMLCFAGALQARPGAPGTATRAPGTICSPAVSDFLENLPGVMFSG